VSGKAVTALNLGDFNGLASLEELDLSDNGLVNLSADVLSPLIGLEWFALENNSLTTLPADLFQGLDNPENLYLTNNNLVSLSAASFNGLSDLELGTAGPLNGNKLTTLPVDVFHSLPSLQILGLSRNNIGS